jgi:16S rRNA G966 N2-methylase RsmD
LKPDGRFQNLELKTQNLEFIIIIHSARMNDMHIPIGKFEGEEIRCTRDRGNLTTRELTIKEELFDIIGTRITGSTVLDINDPNGLYGIESLSRGSEKVTFIGTEKKSNQIISDNLTSLKVGKEAVLKELSVEDYFNTIKKDEKFKIIFFEINRQEEIGTESQMVNHLTEDGLLIMIVPIMGGFQVPVSVEGAVIQESRDCEQRVVLIVSKNR